MVKVHSDSVYNGTLSGLAGVRRSVMGPMVIFGPDGKSASNASSLEISHAGSASVVVLSES